MPIPLLHLRLEAPLQSWGDHSRWYYRDTASEPTKSGIIGLISNALGYERGDSNIEQLDKDLKIGVRVERSGQITLDFQTITGGFRSANDSIQTKNIIIEKE